LDSFGAFDAAENINVMNFGMNVATTNGLSSFFFSLSVIYCSWLAGALEYFENDDCVFLLYSVILFMICYGLGLR
jgi:hypothetical protein